MPHLVILYTPQLDAETDMGALCRKLADTMLAARDDAGQAVFPTGGVRVLAYPAAHSAVADGRRDYAFAYLNLRMARGRPSLVQRRVGEALSATARAHFAPLLEKRYIGITLQIDEGPEVYDSKNSTIHPLFKKD
ncbi:MAG: 5-carboxymethyl-2-hydroxymuconate isomerase [Burkholderiales bacterium]|nr:5-carboxymethyl-2-hydroxymuconate isomerase [Burkholderiales bacterium]MDE2452838.1 5-carboxymethyl-2-hydroxymuconate isomerase [Burkholderiales bacterium]